MRTRLLLVLAALALVVPVHGAGAASSADVMAGLEGKFNLYGRDRAAYLIDVKARISEAGQRIGTGTVLVTIRRCVSVCSKPVTYQAPLVASQVRVEPDLSAGSLATSLFGKPLSLQWSGAVSQFNPAYQLDGTQQIGANVYRVTGVNGLVAGSRCTSKEALLRRGVVYDPAPTVPVMPRKPPRAFAGLVGGLCQSGI